MWCGPMSWDGTVSAVVVQLRSTVTFLTGALAWVTLFTSFLATPVSADQSTASGEIFIHTRVAAIVEIFGDDTDLIWVSDGLSDASNSTLLSGEAEARAKFTVRANQDYFLAVTVPNVWQPSNVLAGDRANHKFVRFDGAATGDYIGGLLFLDEDVGVLQSGSGGDDNVGPQHRKTGDAALRCGNTRMGTWCHFRSQRRWQSPKPGRRCQHDRPAGYLFHNGDDHCSHCALTASVPPIPRLLPGFQTERLR